ncbi:MAG: AMP-binding protein [Gammaproteobacteria bacterium]|nr:AMP-binding protein [Gammaproteobacteria bacterium]
MTTRLSFVSGAGEKPLIYQTIGNALVEAAQRFPQREALVVRHQEIRWTYAELLQRADDLASGLIALGFQPGDRVGIWAPNCAEWVLTQFATARAGLILVNINPAYRTHELEYALNKVACKGLVTASRFKSSDYLAMLAQLAPELNTAGPGLLSSGRLPHLRTVIRLGDEDTSGCYNFGAVSTMGGTAERQRLDELSTLLQPDDAINIQFTSGTTGSPKGATLTHFNILNNGYFVGQAMKFTEADRLCIPVPFYHCFGMVMGNLNCAIHGAAMVIPNDGFDPALTLAAVSEEKCTALYGVPTMFIAELDLPDFREYDLSSLRTGIMAGSSCPIEVMKRVVAEMNMSEITIAYGMTETSPVSFQSSTDDPLERRVSTVGRIHPHVQVKIIDPEGRTVSVGETGELCTRGYNVMSGYWDDPDRTREAIDAAGWMHTGDLATIDAEGYCNIVGRVKDMVIRGGENIYPREVEEFLFGHEKIQDVSVFGVPDDKYGEQLCAWIRLKQGQEADEAEIRAFCKDSLAHYKVPYYVRFVDDFPMTVTGKLQKFIMRDRMIEELGLTIRETA